jgi:hypothetical protein
VEKGAVKKDDKVAREERSRKGKKIDAPKKETSIESEMDKMIKAIDNGINKIKEAKRAKKK